MKTYTCGRGLNSAARYLYYWDGFVIDTTRVVAISGRGSLVHPKSQSPRIIFFLTSCLFTLLWLGSITGFSAAEYTNPFPFRFVFQHCLHSRQRKIATVLRKTFSPQFSYTFWPKRRAIRCVFYNTRKTPSSQS